MPFTINNRNILVPFPSRILRWWGYRKSSTEVCICSIRFLGATFGVESFLNVNPDTHGGPIEFDSEIRRSVEKYRAADIDVYGRAKEIFKRKPDKAGQYNATQLIFLVAQTPRRSPVS